MKQIAQKRILIVGAGITSLALAGLLEKRGVIPDVVEKMSGWQLAGYGITVMPIGVRVLRELGVVTQARRKGFSAPGLNVLTADGEPVHHIALKAGGVDTISMARADLHKILRSHLRQTPIRMGEEVVGIEQLHGAAQVRFSNGDEREYDLVIGADGIRSTVREILFPEVKPQYSGAAVWTFFLPRGVALPSHTDATQIWHDNQFVGVFPFRGRAAVTFSSAFDTNDDVRTADLKQQFADMHVLAKDILRKVNKKNMYSGYLNEIKLHDWYQGQVLLAGDAAHAMLPATGMGSSMGMADAQVIADLIVHTPDAQWNELPKRYQHRRKAQVDRVQWEAAMATKAMFMPGPFKFLRNRTARLIPQFVITLALNDGVRARHGSNNVVK